MNIITRAGWDARTPKTTPTPTTASEAFLHHSVGSGSRDWDNDGDLGDDYMRTMQNFHMDTRGWNDIAYNHAIDPDGLEVYEGRGWGVRPGAQKSHNTGTWSVVVMGDFRSRTVSSLLVSRIAELVTEGITLGHLPPDITLQGHKDAPNQSTTCPGTNLYTALSAINDQIGTTTMFSTQGSTGPVQEYWNRVVKWIGQEKGHPYSVGGATHNQALSDAVVDLVGGDGNIGPREMFNLELQVSQLQAEKHGGGTPAPPPEISIETDTVKVVKSVRLNQ